jgi:hypothetical protein
MFDAPELFPMIRNNPWYPGQLGVPGSDVPRGALTVSRRKVFHVNRLHPRASDAADGTDPENPKVTIQSAVDSPFLEAGDVIVVGPTTTSSTYAGISTAHQIENVVVGNTRPPFVHLMAGGVGPFQVVWDPTLSTTPCLSLKAAGWRVSGFKFHAPATSAAIKFFDSSPVALDLTQYTVIEGNYFDGAYAGKYGIEMTGSPGGTVIRNNWFLEHKQANGSAYAIFESASGNANPYECILEGNIFLENDNHVAVKYGVSLIRNNAFFLGSLIPATVKLDLRAGTVGLNVVTGNIFDGVYTNVGGYYGNAAHPDKWVGNIATPNAGTVADNGFTVLPPA